MSALIAYPFLMHYRRSVFLKLDGFDDLDITFAASPIGVQGVATLSPTEVKRFLSTRVTRFGPFQWQHGLIGSAFFGKFDAAVFLGDWASLSTWLYAAILRMRGVRVFFWTIGWHRPESGFRRFVRLRFYRLANELLLYGDMGREIGLRQGYPADRMRVVFNSVEPLPGLGTNSIAALRSEIEKQVVVGAVVRLNPTKNFGRLLQAVALMNATNGSDIAVLIVGEGAAKEELREEADALGVRLLLPGPAYSDDDLRIIYSLLSTTVVPSAVGLTAVQSLAYGVPVISDDEKYSQGPEWEAIKEGLTGATYRAGDIADLAKKLADWLERVKDDRAGVAAACRQEVDDRWTASNQSARIRGAILERLSR